MDLDRLRNFIRVHNPDAAERAAKKILESVRKLQTHPLLGRPVLDIDHPKLRAFFNSDKQVIVYVIRPLKTP